MTVLEAHLDTCPFCHRPMGDKRKTLYHHPVCPKCYYAFANRRQLAFIIDRVLWVLPTYALTSVMIAVMAYTGQKITQEMADAIDLLSWPLFIVFLLKDGFHGYSPGKWICGVQTIDKATREPAGFLAALKRNLPVFIPIVPLIIAYQLQSGKRWGDGWANTMVIWKKYERSPVFGMPVTAKSANTTSAATSPASAPSAARPSPPPTASCTCPNRQQSRPGQFDREDMETGSNTIFTF